MLTSTTPLPMLCYNFHNLIGINKICQCWPLLGHTKSIHCSEHELGMLNSTIPTSRSWHKIGAAYCPQPISNSCYIFKRHLCSTTSGITLSKYKCEYIWMLTVQLWMKSGIPGCSLLHTHPVLSVHTSQTLPSPSCIYRFLEESLYRTSVLGL